MPTASSTSPTRSSSWSPPSSRPRPPTSGSTSVTPHVFARYPDAAAYAGADRTELETMIQSTGFFRNKSDALIKLGGALVEQLRRRRAGPARRPRHAAGSRTQDRERGAGQRVRRPGHHRRHPLRAARAPVRVDRGDRPGQGRARDRRDVPAARLDDAQPRADLPRPADLPREEAGLRRLPRGRLVPELRRRPDRPRRGHGAAGLRAEAGGDAPGPAARTAARADRAAPSSAGRRPRRRTADRMARLPSIAGPGESLRPLAAPLPTPAPHVADPDDAQREGRRGGLVQPVPAAGRRRPRVGGFVAVRSRSRRRGVLAVHRAFPRHAFPSRPGGASRWRHRAR